MKYSRTKKQKFGIFAIVYSLVIMLAVLQFGGIIFNVSIFAVDVWDVTSEPEIGFSKKLVDKDLFNSEYEFTVSSPEGLAYAMYVTSMPTVLLGINSINNITLHDDNKLDNLTELFKPNLPQTPHIPSIQLNFKVSIIINIAKSIDMSAKYWKPRSISNEIMTKLTILGNDNLISGLRFNSGVQDETSSIYTGLIGVAQVPLNVKDLSLGVLEVSNSSTHFGVLAGATNCKDIELSNCSIHGVIESSKITYSIGGLIGYINDQGAKSITNCWSYCTIKSYGHDINIGGLVGYIGGTGFETVSNCANFGDGIISNGKSTIGGLFGIDKGTISYNKCLNVAKLESSGGVVGGIVGDLRATNVQVNDCYNNADLSCGYSTRIGGLVGSGTSLTFNRCYSNGELKRYEYTIPTLTQDASFGYTSMFHGTYTEFIRVSNSPINIQNNGGGGNSSNNNNGGGTTSSEEHPSYPTDEPPCPDEGETIVHYYDLYVTKYDCGSLNIIPSNLCGGVATYNSSYCRNTYSVSNDFKIMELYFTFSYDGESHDVGSLALYKRGGHCYTFANHLISSEHTGVYEYTFTYLRGRYIGGNGEYISGIRVIPNSSSVEVCVAYTWSGASENYNINGIPINLPSITTTSNGSLTNDINTIKNANLGDEYIVYSDINDGLPVLKDFYWKW